MKRLEWGGDVMSLQLRTSYFWTPEYSVCLCGAECLSTTYIRISTRSPPTTDFGVIVTRPSCFWDGVRANFVQSKFHTLKMLKAANDTVPFEQIIHHESIFRRRGRPIGPRPLGRGLMSIQDFIQDLEREAEEEAG